MHQVIRQAVSLICWLQYVARTSAGRGGAICRPGIDILYICPLGKLIDMYHTHKAAKYCSLLGIISKNESTASLSPNYGVS